MLVLAFFRANWRWLAAVLAAVLAVIFGVLLATQGVSYLTAYLNRRHLRREQTEVSAAHAQQQAATAARYSSYQLDSMKRATERQQLLHNLSISTENDKAIDRARPARVPLPAVSDLPRE